MQVAQYAQFVIARSEATKQSIFVSPLNYGIASLRSQRRSASVARMSVSDMRDNS
jgi:hypothetical protein